MYLDGFGFGIVGFASESVVWSESGVEEIALLLDAIDRLAHDAMDANALVKLEGKISR